VWSPDVTTLDAPTGADGATLDAGQGEDATLDAPAIDAPAGEGSSADAPTADAPASDASCDAAACKPGSVCVGGQCVCGCAPGTIDCGGSSRCQCIDPTTNTDFCGASGDCQGAAAGTHCASGVVCAGGACIDPCFVLPFGDRSSSDPSPLSLVVCNGVCIDPMTNPEHCGASGDCQGANAGAICKAGQVCFGGVCEGLDAFGE
jgi:hypothetical protein